MGREPTTREIPGIGPIVATALLAEIGDWGTFGSPKQHSTGGKERLGSITKQGNRYLRWLLVAGAMAVVRYARQHGTKRAWLTRIMDRRPAKVAAVVLANKIARMAWAIMVRGERYRESKLLLQREYTNWRGHDDVMQIRSFRGSGEPVWVIALRRGNHGC
jgi:transposase